MRLRFWQKEETQPDISPVTPPSLDMRSDTREAIRVSNEAITEGEKSLQELRERKERLAQIRRENHFAPQIIAAFKEPR